jgi:hypothetical protein
VFSFKENGVTVSEAGVPASPPTTSARIFIDYRANVDAIPGRSASGKVNINTGMAIVNLGSAKANLTYTLRGTDAHVIATGHGPLDAGHHFACYINELRERADAPDFILPPDFQTAIQYGSLEIASDQPISVLALRGTTSQRGEYLITTTPVADLNQPLDSDPIYFADFIDGGGFTTSLMLLNTSDATETGTFEITDKYGAPFVVQPVGGTPNSSFTYSIPPAGSFHFQTDGSPTEIRVGWVKLTPDEGTSTPVGSGVFGYNPGSTLESESGIPSSTATTHARVYVDLSGNHNTGLAFVNVADTDASIVINAYQMDGVTGIGTSLGPIPLDPNGYYAAFANEFVADLPAGFTGVLDISSDTPFAALTLRTLDNERGDFLMTTFPVADADRSAPSPIVFPEIIDGGGFKTQFIFISPLGESSATLYSYTEDGVPWAFGE